MGVSDIPKLEHTPVEQISAQVEKTRQSFLEHKTRNVEFRLVQLRKLYWALKDREQKILDALALDLGRSTFESTISETGWVQNDIVYVTRNLRKWLKDEKADDIDLMFKFMNPVIRKDPLGCVLIIGPFNFPFQLTLGPLIGAIAAGNTVVIKPSEAASNSAVLMQEVVEAALDPSCYTIVQGGVPQTQALLAERWDKIFFTGSANVGRIVAKAAAPNLTPVVLELGGINPAIVTKNANPRLVARRMLWGKTLNAGQVCTSQNYLLVEKDIVPAVIEEFKKAYKEYFPKGARASPDYSRIINESSFRRIKGMLDSTQGKILLGGTLDEKEHFIEPTLVQVDSIDDPLITQESFGPILTILPVDNAEEAVKLSNQVMSTPLGIYPFGTKVETDKILATTRSGGAAVNDAALHIPTLPFGGVGESGYGAYRGKASFDVFVHRRPITVSPGWVETFLGIRYPPYAGKLKLFKAGTALVPDFNREGRKIRFAWLRQFLGQKAVGKVVVLAAIIYALAKLRQNRSSPSRA